MILFRDELDWFIGNYGKRFNKRPPSLENILMHVLNSQFSQLLCG